MRHANVKSDLQVAKADLATRIHRLLQQRPLSSDETAALLQVPPSALPPLFDGRLASYPLEALLRLLTGLGDGVEIVIRPQKHGAASSACFRCLPLMNTMISN
jgi:predicted XRE-type DNA-binding protein